MRVHRFGGGRRGRGRPGRGGRTWTKSSDWSHTSTCSALRRPPRPTPIRSPLHPCVRMLVHRFGEGRRGRGRPGRGGRTWTQSSDWPHTSTRSALRRLPSPTPIRSPCTPRGDGGNRAGGTVQGRTVHSGLIHLRVAFCEDRRVLHPSDPLRPELNVDGRMSKRMFEWNCMAPRPEFNMGAQFRLASYINV